MAPWRTKGSVLHSKSSTEEGALLPDQHLEHHALGLGGAVLEGDPQEIGLLAHVVGGEVRGEDGLDRIQPLGRRPGPGPEPGVPPEAPPRPALPNDDGCSFELALRWGRKVVRRPPETAGRSPRCEGIRRLSVGANFRPTGAPTFGCGRPTAPSSRSCTRTARPASTPRPGGDSAERWRGSDPARATASAWTARALPCQIRRPASSPRVRRAVRGDRSGRVLLDRPGVARRPAARAGDVRDARGHVHPRRDLAGSQPVASSTWPGSVSLSSR